jgi:hypothetical protein
MSSPRHPSGAIAVVLGVVLAAGGAGVRAADCTGTATDLVPISDLGTGLYLGRFQGGLYPAGANLPPAAHHDEGLARARALAPLGRNGRPQGDGKVVLLSIGMSNTTQEFCSQSGLAPCDSWTFRGRAARDARVDRTALVLVNGARGGQVADSWDSPGEANYDRVRDTWLTPLGLSEAQVQAAWVKVANAGPTVALPAAGADAYALLASMGRIARALQARYPNLQLAFFSSRIYAGYAATGLNPEPYAYESGFAVKWLVEAQIEQMAGGGVDPLAGDLDWSGTAPWIGWGPYLWADGLRPRRNGLLWRCSDFQSDGTHPARSGESKVGQQLLRFFLSSPYSAPWFRAGAP